MSILFNEEYKIALEKKLRRSEQHIIVLSAFVKVSSLHWLKKLISNKQNPAPITVIARWQLMDLISGASDLSAFEFARDNGWKFAINTNMHYKIYFIDNETLFLGSANLTQKGLHIGLRGNDEANIQITPSEIDIVRLNQYISNCCTVDNDLFLDMGKYVEQHRRQDDVSSTLIWPSDIKERLDPPTDQLWVNDLLFNSPTQLKERGADFVAHDLLLLGFSNISFIQNKKLALSGLRSSVIWKWLLRSVKTSDYDFVRFGEIAKNLHDSLLDDPRPYRRDVKEFLSNLYEWVRYLDPPELGIKKFNHTETLFFREF